MQCDKEQMQQILGLFEHDPVRVLAVVDSLDGTTDKIERYTDGNGLLAEFYATEKRRSWLFVCRQRDAQFYVDRLGSGLIGATMHDTFADAQAQLVEVLAS